MGNLQIVAGILVGGKGSRLGGAPKGLLRAPHMVGPAIGQLFSHLAEAGLDEPYLLGDSSAYTYFGRLSLPDVTYAQGPAAGILALFDHASGLGSSHAIVLACDMPYVTTALLRRLTSFAPTAAAVLPKRTHWEPLCARYEIASCQPVLTRCVERAGGRLQSFVQALGARAVACPLVGDEVAWLDDWDCPSDLPWGTKLECLKGPV